MEEARGQNSKTKDAGDMTRTAGEQRPNGSKPVQHERAVEEAKDKCERRSCSEDTRGVSTGKATHRKKRAKADRGRMGDKASGKCVRGKRDTRGKRSRGKHKRSRRGERKRKGENRRRKSSRRPVAGESTGGKEVTSPLRKK